VNPLQELEAKAIPVTWATVAIGLAGPGPAPPQIGLPDVQSWLETALARGGEPERAVDVIVAIDGSGNARQIISDLAAHSATDAQEELRKWQIVMLREQLAGLPPDPFYTALSLADFWSQFEDGGDGPAPTADELTSALTTSDRERLVHRQEAWLTAAERSLAAHH
jgi:hypothetical protein